MQSDVHASRPHHIMYHIIHAKCGCSQPPYDSSSRHLPTWLSATSTCYSTLLRLHSTANWLTNTITCKTTMYVGKCLTIPSFACLAACMQVQLATALHLYTMGLLTGSPTPLNHPGKFITISAVVVLTAHCVYTC